MLSIQIKSGNLDHYTFPVDLRTLEVLVLFFVDTAGLGDGLQLRPSNSGPPPLPRPIARNTRL